MTHESSAADVSIREAMARDAAVIAHHRVAMFRDMGTLQPQFEPQLTAWSIEFLSRALAEGEYLGWLAAPNATPDQIVAGAGVQLRRVLPHPSRDPARPGVAWGRQAIVLNVYTEPQWRRRGIARLLMQHVVAWARRAGIETLVLHTSTEGRALYEALGFAATNEMRFTGPLALGESAVRLADRNEA